MHKFICILLLRSITGALLLFLLAFVICMVAACAPLVGDLILSDIDTLVQLAEPVMNSTTTSTWYYVISSLGIYHSYSPIVETSLGSVRGIISSSRGGREFYEYRSIPFAKPPINELRFEPPVPASAWKGILDATNLPPACLQFDAMIRGDVHGSEDCLFLNIYTPNIKPKKLMPMIAYIHGGGFTGGESSPFGPKYFMDHDVVVATFNYRLAALGFLNTGDELIRGNMGLKDQNCALKWLKENAIFFGADPDKITLMGESAGYTKIIFNETISNAYFCTQLGGACVHYHTISPLSRGLFQKAIIQSGSLGSPWSFTRNPQNQAMKFGKQLNCPIENTTVLVDCLKKMDPQKIVEPHVIIMSPVHTQDDFFPGSVEAVEREDTFLSENPYLMLEKGDFAKIPVMIGVNDGEGGLKAARLESYSEVLDELDQDEKWNDHVSVLMHYDPNKTEVSEKLRDYYFTTILKNGTHRRINPASDIFNLTKMLGAGIFFEGNHRIAEFHSKHVPTYLYYYAYISDIVPSSYAIIRAGKPHKWYHPWPIYYARGLINYYLDKIIWRSKDPKIYGSCHGDDIPQVFSMNSIFDVKKFTSDYPFSKELVKTFVKFASEENDPSFNNIHWPPVDPKDKRPKYMELNKTGGIIDEPFTEEVEFIKSLNIRDPLEKNNW